MTAAGTSSSSPRPRPLEGVRVLDLTLFLSGPFGTQMLADLGAEVIKIEPLGGDQTRFLPPHFVGDDSAYYLSVNRSKESLALDYKTPEGRALLEQLADQSDVLIENLRPGALARYGIDYEAYAKRNPRLVWCSISGFGQDGPDAGHPAYDMIVQAMSGGMSMTGEVGGKPVRSGIPLGDLAAGMYAATTICAVLAGREKTGHGERIDISMLDCQVAMLCYQAAYYLASGKTPGLQGRGHDSIPTYRAFTGGDGIDFVMCCNTDRMWRSMCAAIGRRDLGESPELADRQQRYVARHRIWEELEAAFAAKPASEWVDILQHAEVPVALVNTVDRALAEPQVAHRRMVVEMQDRDGHVARVVGDPMKIPTAAPTAYRYPPGLGANGDEILRRVLDMRPEDIAALRETGALGPAARETVQAPT